METVCLLSKLKDAKNHVEVEVAMNDLKITSADK